MDALTCARIALLFEGFEKQASPSTTEDKSYDTIAILVETGFLLVASDKTCRLTAKSNALLRDFEP